MALPRTQKITYNLKNRGRAYTGQDRSGLDLKKVIGFINGGATQERVNSGDMLGYYGHQIRQTYGMTPPEQAIIGGVPIRLDPAIRTVELSANNNGDVTHVQEFLDTDIGLYCHDRFKANIGGFSSAMDGKGFHGFDLVLQPNYATNKGKLADAIMDGATLNEVWDFIYEDDIDQATIQTVKPYLEREIAAIYDSVAMDRHINNLTEQVSELVSASVKQRQLFEAKQQRQRERQKDIYDSIVFEKVPFKQCDVMQNARMFDSINISNEGYLQPKKQVANTHLEGLTSALGRVFG